MGIAKALALLSLVAIAYAGFWLDKMLVLNHTAIYTAFQLTSLSGALTAAVWWFGRVTKPIHCLYILLAVLLAWRISYFPIMVFSGWFATLGERVEYIIPVLPHVIYPVFLVFMYVLHGIGGLAAGSLVTFQARRLMVITIPAFIIAILVSFTSIEDLTVLPDRQTKLSQPLPPVGEPVANPYLAALNEEGYNFSQRVLLFSAGSIYSFIPNTPWSGAVKGTLEEAFNRHPNSTTANRIKEHYLAYHVAHKQIVCRHECT